MRQTGSVNKNHVLFTDTFWKDGCLGKQEMGNYTTNKKGCQTNFCWPFFFLGNYDENCWNPQYFTIFLNLKVEHKTSLVIIPQLFRKYKNLPWHLGPIGNNAGCELRRVHLEYFWVSQLLQWNFLVSAASYGWDSNEITHQGSSSSILRQFNPHFWAVSQ